MHMAPLCLAGASLWRMNSWRINLGTLLTMTRMCCSISQVWNNSSCLPEMQSFPYSRMFVSAKRLLARSSTTHKTDIGVLGVCVPIFHCTDKFKCAVVCDDVKLKPSKNRFEPEAFQVLTPFTSWGSQRHKPSVVPPKGALQERTLTHETKLV